MGRLSFHWEAMYEVLVMSGQTSVRDRQVNAQIEPQGAAEGTSLMSKRPRLS